MIKFIILLIVPFLLFANEESRAFTFKLKKMKSEKRVALIIGNADYSNFSPLKNPINDAKAISKILLSKNFEVISLYNASQVEMEESIDRFYQKLRTGGIGLFYYAGHGIEVDGVNYLIPINTKIKDKKYVKYKAVATNLVIDLMEKAHNRLNIVILDACRNDPFSRGGGGLAPINTATGIYVAYATAPGKVASDGSGEKWTLYKAFNKTYEQKRVRIR